MKLLDRLAMAAAPLAACVVLLGVSPAQQVHRNSFEGPETGWVRGGSDTNFREIAHRITEDTAYKDQRSEGIQFETEQGNYIHYTYDCPRALLSEELSISLRFKASRTGMRLLARLVLPHERSPDNLDERITMLLKGDVYELNGQWQRLELRRPVKLAKEQQQILQAQYKKAIDLTDAYIDRLVLNVYGGPGQTQVWIDDLEVSPVLDNNPFKTTSRPDRATPAIKVRDLPAAPAVKWDHEQLVVGGNRVFFRAIRHTDTPLRVLKDAGFNTVAMDESSTSEQIDEAVRLGFRIVPVLSVFTNDNRLVSNDSLGQRVGQFLRPDAVLFWGLGSGGLSQDQHSAVAQAAQTMRALDSRPLTTDVWDGFLTYSRTVDMLGVHRWPLMTSLELNQYREWLNQRRLLAQPGTFTWTWVQTHLPDWYVDLIYKQSGTAAFNEPIGPQPEQIRLLSYLAVAAGCRGLGFWSDRFLADSHQGRDRLLTMALINQELQLLEPMLTTAESPVWIDTDNADVKAAVLRTPRGILVLPMWTGSGSQYVPGQDAVASLTFTVPGVPMGTQALEVSPGGVHGLQVQRVVGGMKVTLRDFGLTAAIVFTGDNGPDGLLVYFQDQARRMKHMAAQWAKDLAIEEHAKVSKVEAEMAQLDHAAKNADELLKKSQEYIDLCKQHWSNGADSDCYAEAQHALRPLRILMRAEWQDATRILTTPTASPYALSYYTLPRHWRLVAQLKQMTLGSNVLPEGDFEVPVGQQMRDWTVQKAPTLDEVEMQPNRVQDDGPHEGRQCLKLEIKPKNPASPPAALERSFLAVHSPDVNLPAGSWVQISGWVKIPKAIAASVDGAMLYDSAGDAPLAVRAGAPCKWQQFILYREVPASGKIHVTLALTGIGSAYFDDIRLQPLVPKDAGR